MGAECSDSEGAPIDWEKVLTFSLANQTATIKTKQTAYCTLYFAKGTPALDWLRKKGGETFAGGGEHTTAVDGLYRFKGTNTQVLNNYICFGTVVESECLKSPETYMYRIIGITSEADTTIGLYANQLKIIKTIPSRTNQKWYRDSALVTPWDDSDLKTYLNGTTENENSDGFLQTIIDGTDGNYWINTISNHHWYNGEKKVSEYPNTVPAIEPKTSYTIESKIGLMYASDYFNAYGKSTSNWLYIKNGWSSNTDIDEWTMTSYGHDYYNYLAWIIHTRDSLIKDYAALEHAVRPVFYLRPGINLKSEGTKEHPYLITTMSNV